MSETVARVLAGDLCSGCGLCEAVGGGAYAMAPSPEGYNRPVRRTAPSAQAERTIAASCPGSVAAPWPVDAPVHPYWGAHRISATGYAADEQIRHHASSGGGITGLLVHALVSGAIEGVVQIVADPARPAYNRATISRTRGEILAASGSRYAASSPLAGIEAVLAGSGRYAFVGKPCDVSALRQLARLDPRVDERFALMLAFFCAGIPSGGGIDEMLAAMGADPARMTAFRYRGDGWPGMATATHADGSTAKMSYNESWGGHLSRTLQFRCKICPDSVGGAADVACADAWYGDDGGYPSFDEQDGRSVVLARTPAGEALVRSAVAAGALVIEPLAITEIDKMQPAQARRKRELLARFAALALVRRPRPRAKGLLVGIAARRASLRETVRSFAGLLRRLVR